MQPGISPARYSRSDFALTAEIDEFYLADGEAEEAGAEAPESLDGIGGEALDRGRAGIGWRGWGPLPRGFLGGGFG